MVLESGWTVQTVSDGRMSGVNIATGSEAMGNSCVLLVAAESKATGHTVYAVSRDESEKNR